MATTNSPTVSRRYWYANLSSSHTSLHKMKPYFFTKNILHLTFYHLCLPCWEIKAVFSVTFCSFSLFSPLPHYLASGQKGDVSEVSPRLPSPLFSDYQEEKKGRLQWKVCVKALPSVTTRPCPPERLRSTTTRGICTSWMGLFPSLSACVRFNTWGQTAFMYETQKPRNAKEANGCFMEKDLLKETF